MRLRTSSLAVLLPRDDRRQAIATAGDPINDPVKHEKLL
jgi:hypothetical protein